MQAPRRIPRGGSFSQSISSIVEAFSSDPDFRTGRKVQRFLDQKGSESLKKDGVIAHRLAIGEFDIIGRSSGAGSVRSSFHCWDGMRTIGRSRATSSEGLVGQGMPCNRFLKRALGKLDSGRVISSRARRGSCGMVKRFP